MRITSVIISENILTDPEGRTTLLNVFPVFRAPVFPAAASLMVTTAVLMEEGDSPQQLRVAVVDLHGDLIGEARVAIPVGLEPGMQFLQTARFSGMIFPEPGRYRVESSLGDGEVVSMPFMVFAEQAG